MDLSRLTTDELYSERDLAWDNLRTLTPADRGYARAEAWLTTVKMEINRRIARQMAHAARLCAA